MVDVVNILQTLIANIDYNLYCKNITDNLDGSYTIDTCNTLHAREGMYITIDAEEYVVTDFVLNSYITITGGTLDLTRLSITLPALGFESGKLSDVDGERVTKKRLQQQVSPFVWNREPFNVVGNTDKLSNLYGNVSLTLYFMGDCNPNNMFTADHREQVINPMKNFADHFINYVNKRRNYFGIVSSFEIIDRPFLEIQGVDGGGSRLFDENLSGVELRIDVPLKNNCVGCQ